MMWWIAVQTNTKARLPAAPNLHVQQKYSCHKHIQSQTTDQTLCVNLGAAAKSRARGKFHGEKLNK